MAIPTILPPGISPPLTQNNSHNHNALIVIIASLSLFLALASLAIRTYAISRRGAILKDDYVLLTIVIVACAQVSVALNQVHYGWGKSKELISSDDYEQMAKTGFAVDILYIVVIGLSKICTMMFYRNLSLRNNVLLSNTILASCGIWIMLGIILLGVRCSSNAWQDIDDTCAGLYPRWQSICALDIVLEIAILAYPVKIIHNVQIVLLKKLKVLCILSCRVILIPLSAFHLVCMHKQTTSPNPSLDGAYATTIAELHLGFSVALLTISSLKIFVAVYEDEQGLAYTEDGSKSQSQSGRGTRTRTWRASRPAKDPMLLSAAGDEEPILPSSVSASSAGHDRGPSGGGRDIVKSVHISVTSESIELQERGGPATSVSGTS